MKVYLRKRAVWRSLNRKAKKRNIATIEKTEDIAERIITKIQSLELKEVSFDKIFVNNPGGRKNRKLLLASVSISENSMLIINREWVFHILCQWDKPGCQDALRITIGHEISHKHDINMHCIVPRRHYLNKKLNEVYADFHAAELLANSKKKVLIQSADYKLQRYNDAKKKDKPHRSHPSWKQRKTYAEIGKFNKELINLIASDAKFKNKKFIEKISEAYSENVELQ